MRRLLISVVVCACAASPALASVGNANYRSNILSMTPKTPGVSLDVLQFDDRLQITNHSGKTITVDGYNGEPYLQILGNGTVQLNKDSPAYYLNAERSEEGETVPAGVDGKGAPQWTTVDKTGRYDWHDHRIHWMAPGLPPQVKDKHKKTEVFPWKVPIKVGSQSGNISGVLFWVGKNNSGPPVGAIIGFVVLVLLGSWAVVVSRRRRGGDDDDDGGPGPERTEAPAAEAW